MSKERHGVLFDRPVFVGEQQQTLTLQVYEILCEEIRAGRWETGERLPSVAMLAEQSGLSRGPLQKAFERLREEGFISQKRGAGSHLTSPNPRGDMPAGTVGIIISYQEQEDGFRPDYLWTRLEYVQKEISRHNLVTEVKYLPLDTDWSTVDRVGMVFGNNVKGVISLHVFDRRYVEELGADQLPFCCVGSQTDLCLPMVAGDTYNAAYRMTRRVLEAGHRRILLATSAGESDYENNNRIRGHRDAMEEAGLEMDDEALQKAMALTNGNVRTAREFLEAYPDATALIYMVDRGLSDLIHAADILGRDIPRDLSLVGSLTDVIHTSRGSFEGSRMEHDKERIIETALNLLDDQRKTRQIRTARVLVRPIFIEGQTLAPPRKIAAR